MLAAEVLKIWKGRFLEHNEEVDLFALTFDGIYSIDYNLLNQELKSKYFQDQEENQVQVGHWQDCMKQFTQDHKDKLIQDQRNLLEMRTAHYKDGGEDVKSVLMTFAEVLNESKRKAILMVDEININKACKKTTKEGKISYEVDFSYLRQYENIYFILCLRPNAKANDFQLIIPTQKESQLYKNLHQRHRNTLEILKFLRFYQENNPDDNNSPNIQNEQILEKESLPPLVEGLDHGVIWISLKNKR